jgi:hypothetical protein
MTVLSQDLTYKYTDSGVVLNSDPPGDFVDITKITGLDNATFREANRDHEGTDGGFLDAEFEKARIILASGTVYSSPTTIMSFLDQLKANFAPTTTPQPFYMLMGSVGERVVFAKSNGCSFSIDTAYRVGTADIQFKLTAEDPTIYDSQLSQVQIPLGATVNTGIGFPLGFAFGFGGVTGSGDGRGVYNGGNRPAGAILSISGGTGVVDPVIINDTTGSTLQFSGLTLSSTDVLTIDLRNKTVLLNGAASRRSALVNPQWFLLQQGTNFIRYRAASVGGGSILNVAYRNAWR